MYQIGEFSKICQVSVKTLRYYDGIGLLKPSSVDRFTGYRYYDRSQLERMLLIQKLKRYGFPLEEIGALLSGGEDAFRRALRRQRDKLEAQRVELETILQELDAQAQAFERTGNIMDISNGYEIKLTETEPVAVFSLRKRMGAEDYGKYFSDLYERIAKEGLTPGGATGAMYHEEEYDRESSEIELFVSVREAGRADKTLEPRLCATTVHKGAYSTLNEAYAALVSWIEENGYERDGAPYDVYRQGAWSNLAPKDWETEIYFPVRKKA